MKRLPLLIAAAFAVSPSLFSQNIGVGESAPSTKLEIRGDSGTDLFNVKDQAGDSKLYILNNGNVGIGTTAPSHILHVAAGNGGIRIGPNSSYGENLIIGGWTSSVTDARVATSNGNLHIDSKTGGSHIYLNHYHNGNVFMAAGASQGNVGIGTTSPAFKLDVSGTGRYTGQLTIPLTPSVDANAASKKYVDDQIAGSDEWDKSGSDIYNNNSGDVGIGTSSPNNKLEVSGSFGIRRSVNNAAIWFNSGTDQNHVLWNDYYGGPITKGTGGSGFDGIKWNTFDGIQFRTGGGGATDRLLILHNENEINLLNSNVGIGTSAPGSTLDVHGSFVVGSNATNVSADGSGSFGSTTANYNPTNGTWASGGTALLLNGLDYSTIGFHDSGSRVDFIRTGGGVMQLGYDGGWGAATVQIPSLAGSGTRSLVADGSGNLSTQSINGGFLPNGSASQTLYHNGSNWVAGSNLLNDGSQVTIGSFTNTNSDEWPKAVWLRDTGNDWDEGLIKGNSSRGVWGREGFGIHMDDSRHFGFFSSGWDALFDVEGGSGRTYIKGRTGIGTVAATGAHLHVHNETTYNGTAFLNASNRTNLAVTGTYPNIVIASSVSNSNHAGSLSFWHNQAGGATTTQWNMGASDNGFSIGYGTNNSNPHVGLENYTTPSVMSLETNGNVGIGTISPGAKLDVSGNIKANGNSTFAASDNGSTSYSVAALELRESGFGGAGNLPPRLSFHWGGVVASQIAIESNGTIAIRNNPGTGYEDFRCLTVTSNGIRETSDARLKEEINPISGALEKITQMQGVTYNWDMSVDRNEGLDESLQYGLIAQELEKVIPELVATDEEGWKSIEYSHLVPVLIEAIKEQQTKMEAMEARHADEMNCVQQQMEEYKTMAQDIEMLKEALNISAYSASR